MRTAQLNAVLEEAGLPVQVKAGLIGSLQFQALPSFHLA